MTATQVKSLNDANLKLLQQSVNGSGGGSMGANAATRELITVKMALAAKVLDARELIA